MASSFKLTLDTTSPVFTVELAGGSLVTGTPLTALRIAMDVGEPLPLPGYQFKIWGDVDPTGDPAIQPKEEDSEWVNWANAESLEELLEVLLSEGEGPKAIQVSVRDDLWNTFTQEATIDLNESVPVITITAGPTPTKISNVATKNVSAFTFKSSEDIAEWKTELVASAGDAEGTGTLIEDAEAAGGEVEAETNQNGKIHGEALTGAAGGIDGQYIIKVFGKSKASGLWSA